MTNNPAVTKTVELLPCPLCSNAEVCRIGGVKDRMFHPHGPCELSGKSFSLKFWNIFTRPEHAPSLSPDAEDAAWTWLESKYLNVEAGHDPNDRDYSADEMVDAFIAGLEATAALAVCNHGDERLEKVLADLVFYAEWHMPYKGEHHPTYAAPVQAAHQLLKQRRIARTALHSEGDEK